MSVILGEITGESVRNAVRYAAKALRSGVANQHRQTTLNSKGDLRNAMEKMGRGTSLTLFVSIVKFLKFKYLRRHQSVA